MHRLLRVALWGWASLAGAQDLVPGRPEAVGGYSHEKGDNPSGLMPAHQTVPFGPGAKLDVVQVAAWEQAFASEPEVQRACVSAPVSTLRGLLRSKGRPPAQQKMPIVGCMDAREYFTLHARRVRFSGGEGFLFVTQQFIEAVLASNDGLVAMFQGLSDDGKVWVGGSFRIRARGLRDTVEDLVRDERAYKKAMAADAEMLAKLKAADFDPSLDAIAAAIGTLVLP